MTMAHEKDFLSADNENANGKEQGIEVKSGGAEVVVVTDSEAATENGSQNGQTPLVPLRMKLFSILLVTAVGFGSHWSSGVTGAMKSTLKKVSRILKFPHPVIFSINTL
jgi:hypothetical protein